MFRRRVAAIVATSTLCLSAVAVPLASASGADAPTRAATVSVYCSNSAPTAFLGCYTPGGATPLSVPAGSVVSADPQVPGTAHQTTGLSAPDGILGIVPPGKEAAAVPKGAVTVMYIEKQVGYFTPATTTAKVTLPATTVPLSSMPYTSFPVTVYAGTGTKSAPGTIVAVTCAASSGDSLTGCTGGSGTVASGASVGSPGACITPFAALDTIGEGKNTPSSLFGNNEDLARAHEAYTTDGTHFVDITPANFLSTVAVPDAQTGLRWVSPGGTIVNNPDGTLGLFFSGGSCTDGDSDAFNSVFYTTSSDGVNWAAPQQIAATDALNPKLSSDYSYKASIANQQPGAGPLDVSGYYEGRIYSPSVVPNPDGTLTMTFAGYRTSKPLPSTGPGAKAIGRAAGTTDPATIQYIPAVTDPALYRNILTVGLTLVPGKGGTPDSYTAGLPKVAQVTNGPWTLSQGDPAEAPYQPNGGTGGAYTTYTPGGTPTNIIGGVAYPNLSTYPGPGTATNPVPYTTAYAGTPGPLAGYCGAGPNPSNGAVAAEPANMALPMSPYYFPHIDATATPGHLIGYFDYRPKDTDEAVVIATSNDYGQTWAFEAEALQQRANHCPSGNTDLANGANPTTNDDGQGHPYDLTVHGVHLLYTLNRPPTNGDRAGSELLVHRLNPNQPNYGLPASETVGEGGHTVATGPSQTITNNTGGISTDSFSVASTANFEMPGRILVTPAGAPPRQGPARLPSSIFGTAPVTASKPDDITVLDGIVYVGYQNGIGTDGSPGPSGATKSTVAGFDQRTGALVKSIAVTGKVDGLRADPRHDRLIATVNEDLNSALYVIDPSRQSATRYTYSPNPATPISPTPTSDPTTAGGTDSIAVTNGHIYLAHSFPAGAVNFPSATDTFSDPTEYEVTLDSEHHRADLRPLWKNDSRAADAVTGQSLRLRLTDPDSNSIMPESSPRFAGQLEQMSQGDGQMIFADGLPGKPTLTQLTLTDNLAGNAPPIDDIAVATSNRGTLYMVDAGAGTIVKLDTKGWPAGTVFVAEPSDNSNPLVGTLNLSTGAITPLGNTVSSPKGLLFIPDSHDPER